MCAPSFPVTSQKYTHAHQWRYSGGKGCGRPLYCSFSFAARLTFFLKPRGPCARCAWCAPARGWRSLWELTSWVPPGLAGHAAAVQQPAQGTGTPPGAHAPTCSRGEAWTRPAASLPAVVTASVVVTQQSSMWLFNPRHYS